MPTIQEHQRDAMIMAKIELNGLVEQYKQKIKVCEETAEQLIAERRALRHNPEADDGARATNSRDTATNSARLIAYNQTLSDLNSVVDYVEIAV